MNDMFFLHSRYDDFFLYCRSAERRIQLDLLLYNISDGNAFFFFLSFSPLLDELEKGTASKSQAGKDTPHNASMDWQRNHDHIDRVPSLGLLR
jgi:hypothetical protein